MSCRELMIIAALWLCACPPPSGPCKSNEGCPTGQSCCEGACINTQTDEANCGSCGNVCEFPNGTGVCKAGACQLTCGAGFANCNTTVTDGCEQPIAESVTNCGGCGRTCTSINAEPVCIAYLCKQGACSAGYANCDNSTANGCEIDTRVDVRHCGGCGQACQLPHASSQCVASACQVVGCDGGYGNCDGAPANGCEAHLPSDPQHCGRCNLACGPQQQCVASACRANELIVFGGTITYGNSATTNAVFRFDLGTNTFTPLSPATPDGAIPSRTQASATADLARNRMVVWGGVDGTGTPVATDTWALDFAVSPPAWRKLTVSGTPPSPRFGAASALDESRSKWFLFGGQTELGAGLSDLYVFDLATNAWAQVHGNNAPGAPRDRVNAAAAFDPAEGKLLLFGGNGVTGADLRELWRFDADAGTWQGGAASDGPVGRARPAFVSGHPAYLFSGVASLLNPPASMLADVWSLDVTATPAWVFSNAAGPAERFNAAHTTRDGKLYVFGGGAITGTGPVVRTDLWRYDPAMDQWARLADGDGGVPTGKLGATAVAR